MTYTLIPYLILWNLQKNRNVVVFEGSSKSSAFITAVINNELHSILMVANYIDLWVTACLLSSYAKCNRVTIQAMHQDKPSPGLVKRNTDGARRGNPSLSGGRGVIRDSNGSLIYAFSSFFGDGSNTMAEVRALFKRCVLVIR